jgi:F-type H+-transporting ATPase subunit b
MQIDWITVSAQIVNFLVLVWLLKRFLYRPIVEAMQRRERRIAERVEKADAREREAEDKAREYLERREKLDRERDDILASATEEAEHKRRELLDSARDEVEAQRGEWQQQLARESDDFAAGLRQRTSEAVQAISRRALSDLADITLEARVVDVFVDRLRAADDDTRDALARADGPLLVHSSFELDAQVRSRLTRALHETLASEIQVDYDRDSELLCGIELRHGHHRLGWNLAEYMAQLEQRLGAAFSPAGGRSGER